MIMKNALLFIFCLCFTPGLASSDVVADSPEFKEAREQLIRDYIEGRGISDPLVLKAMRNVPRHYFVPEKYVAMSYRDQPLPIGEGQTISQPYVVALMTAKLELHPNQRVLEIGTGSGYQAAILASIVAEVYTIEIKKKLCENTAKRIDDLGFANIRTRCGDGYFGWEEAAPFDAVMITAAVDHIPPPLLQQLKDGGKLILPLGNPFLSQVLTLVTRKGDDYRTKQITAVGFVPMTGYAEQH